MASTIDNTGTEIDEGSSSTNNTMLAFCIEKPGDTVGQVVTLPKPQPDGPGFAVIRVLRAGVCNTDLEILQGYMGFTGILGHEFVGIVESVHVDSSRPHDEALPWIGQRVCGDINVGCNECAVCHDTLQYNTTRHCPQMSRNHCPKRTVLGILQRHGTMAQYLTLPLRNLHKVPDHVSDEVAVFSEPLAAACRIPEQGLIRYDATTSDKVAILGDGKLGLMIAEVLGRAHLQHYGPLPENYNMDDDDNNNKSKAYPQAPILFGKHLHKLQLVAESGVVGKLVSECQDASSTHNGVAKPYAGQFDVVVDATGSPAGLTLAAGLCRPMGTLVLKSTCAAGEQFNAAPFVIDELRVVGSRCGPIDQALRLLALTTNDDDNDDHANHDENGDKTTTASRLPPLRVEKYITKTFPLAQAAKAIQCAAEKSTMKVQIICNES